MIISYFTGLRVYSNTHFDVIMTLYEMQQTRIKNAKTWIGRPYHLLPKLYKLLSLKLKIRDSKWRKVCPNLPPFPFLESLIFEISK
jgi:hypothetical protein